MSQSRALVLVFVILLVLGLLVVWYRSGSEEDATLALETSPASSMETTSTSLTTVSTDDFASSLTETDRVIVDVRTPEEYAAGHIDGAVNIDFYSEDFQTELNTLDKTTPYAVYCRSGNRSGQALETMRSLGFTSVVDLRGGVVAWQQAGKTLCSTSTC